MVAAPSTLSKPAGAKAGDMLVGSVTWLDGEGGKLLEGSPTAPEGLPVKVILGPAAAKDKESSKDSKKGKGPEVPPGRTWELAMTKAHISELGKLKGKDDDEGVFEKQFPDVLAKAKAVKDMDPQLEIQVLQAMLHHLDHASNATAYLPMAAGASSEKVPDHAKIEAAADAVIAAIDQDELAKKISLNVPDNDDEAVGKEKGQFSEERAVDAISRKGIAISRSIFASAQAQTEAADASDVTKRLGDLWTMLQKWCNTEKSSKITVLAFSYANTSL